MTDPPFDGHHLSKLPTENLRYDLSTTLYQHHDLMTGIMISSVSLVIFDLHLRHELPHGKPNIADTQDKSYNTVHVPGQDSRAPEKRHIEQLLHSNQAHCQIRTQICLFLSVLAPLSIGRPCFNPRIIYFSSSLAYIGCFGSMSVFFWGEWG
jgi:hypothetical protein